MDVSVLSISDKLLEVYRSEALRLAWFLSSRKHPDLTQIYCNVIKRVPRLFGIKKLVFFGTSGGGFPALYFASLFRGACLAANAQLYLPHGRMVKLLAKQDDMPVYESLDTLFRRGETPSHAILSVNKADVWHYQENAIPFAELCGHHRVSFQPIFFDCPCQEPHKVQFNTSYSKLLDSL